MRNKHLKEMSLEYQLGFYIGEQIVDRKLINLSIDMAQGMNVIDVSDEDRLLYEAVESSWHKATKEVGKSSHAWDDMQSFRREMERKYLPETIDCYFSKVQNVVELDEFKRGIGNAMWDCDRSQYSCDINNIEVKDEGDWTIITVNRAS